jgi:ABC-type oligopeptide transport system substrate-binding subunit
MRHSACHLLAAASILLVVAPGVEGARRPRYGGTLRVEERTARALEPAAWPMVFETLVELDDSGKVRPALAVSWRHDAASRRWQFRLRPNVKFQDGSPLTAEAVAAALGGNGWLSTAAGGEVIVLCDALTRLADFSDARRAVFLKGADGALTGTGPFRVAQWEARRAVLAAHEEYWRGRPFLDGATIEMGGTAQQRLADLELAKAELVEVGPGEVRGAEQFGAKIWTSSPVILMALKFEPGRPAADNARLREALALSIDRAAILKVLLQKRGEAAGGLLPQWLSGYAALFATARDVARARELAAGGPALALDYDASDGLARMVAERIAVNAREAGIRLAAPAPAGNADAILVRVRIAPAEAEQALEGLGAALRLPELLHPASPALEDLYADERAVVEDYRVIPLFHLPEIYGASPRLHAWATPGLLKTGEWRLEDLWLDAEQR